MRDWLAALGAMILAVVDVYEAMTCDRDYRRAIGQERAQAELRAGAGTQLDARVVGAPVTALRASVA